MSQEQIQAWDVDKPCTFLLWHKPTNKRCRVRGYSFNQFLLFQGWKAEDCVASYVSNRVNPRMYFWFQTDETGKNRWESVTSPEKGE